jgi:hypothetical protein
LSLAEAAENAEDREKKKRDDRIRDDRIMRKGILFSQYSKVPSFHYSNLS